MVQAVSFSQLNLLARCPWLWGLQYRAKLTPIEDASVPMQLGGLIHDGLAVHHEDPKLKKKLDWQVICKGADPVPDGEILQDAAWLVDLYREHYGEETFTVLATEWPFAVPVKTPKKSRSNYLLIGWIDLISVDSKGRLWIWDHKSGKSFPSVIELAQDFQLSTYAWALREMGAEIGGVTLNLLRTTKKTKKERFVRDPIPKTDAELDQWGYGLYRRCREIPPPKAQWLELAKHTGKDCSWCRAYELCHFHQTGQFGAMKDLLEAEYQRKKPRGGRGWLRQYHRKLPVAWLAKSQATKVPSSDIWDG